MSLDDSEPMFSLGGGCMAHGDEFMTECSVCGAEFCARCHPGIRLCSDCAVTQSEDDDLDGAPVAPGAAEDDEDVEKLLKEADELDLSDGGADEADKDNRD